MPKIDNIYKYLRETDWFDGAHAVFTPQALVEDVLSKIDLTTGTILVLYNVEFVASLVYTYDVDPARITLFTDHPNKITWAKKIGTNHTERLEKHMKFDVIVGNPPFQESNESGERKDQASNLWSKFWSSSLKIATDKGIVALITPTSWLSPSADLKGTDRYQGTARLWDIFNSFTSHANVVDVEQHFKGVGSSFGYVVVDKGGHSGLTFSDSSDTSLGFLPKSNIGFVAAQLSNTGNIGDNFVVNQTNTPDLRVSIPMTRVLDDDSIEILTGATTPTRGSDKEGLYLYVHVSTQQQADLVRDRVKDCIPILNDYCRWNGYLNIKVTKMIKLLKTSSNTTV
jgi:hypothetical protein